MCIVMKKYLFRIGRLDLIFGLFNRYFFRVLSIEVGLFFILIEKNNGLL